MKKAVITGGSTGLGLLMVKALINDGYFVYNIDIVKSNFINNNLLQLTYDINMTNLVLKEFIDIKKIDLLINNTLINVKKDFTNITFDEIDLVLNTNINSIVKLTNKLLDKMNNNSCILNVTSNIGKSKSLTLDMSIASIEMFTTKLSQELTPKIKVNSLSISNSNQVEEEEFNTFFKTLLNNKNEYKTGSVINYKKRS